VSAWKGTLNDTNEVFTELFYAAILKRLVHSGDTDEMNGVLDYLATPGEGVIPLAARATMLRQHISTRIGQSTDDMKLLAFRTAISRISIVSRAATSSIVDKSALRRVIAGDASTDWLAADLQIRALGVVPTASLIPPGAVTPDTLTNRWCPDDGVVTGEASSETSFIFQNDLVLRSSTIPTCVADLVAATRLRLDNCKLTGTIPSELALLTKLYSGWIKTSLIDHCRHNSVC